MFCFSLGGQGRSDESGNPELACCVGSPVSHFAPQGQGTDMEIGRKEPLLLFGGLDLWFGFGFEPLFLVEGNRETPL